MQGINTNSKLKIALVGILLLVVVIVPMSAFAGHGGSKSSELEVVGQFPIPIESLTTDVWAFGNYVYIGSFNQPECSLDLTGVRIIDISDPTDPEQVAFIAAKPGTRNNDVKVEHINTPHFSGEILVITNEECNAPFHPRQNSKGGPIIPGQGGIAIWNVSDPAKPKPLMQNFLDKANGIHNTFIWQQGENAYLIAVDDVDVRDVIIVDITKPQSPKEIARTGGPDWPDNFSEIEGPAVFLHDVWVQENDGKVIAYLSYWDSGLVLLDVTNPTNPQFLGDSTYPNPDEVSGLPPEGNGHVAAPTEDGQITILGDEDFGKFSAFGTFTIGGTSSTNKVGTALFGPQPVIDTFPEPGDVVAVAANFGCNASDFSSASGGSADVVLIQRGVCFFSTKAANAQAAGYDAYIVYNDAARGDGLINMSAGTDDVITIPGIFVGHTVGSTMAAEIIGDGTVTVNSVEGIFDGEGFMRVLDVSDPEYIVQLGHFATEGVFSLGPIPDDRTAHNVIVRDGRAYWSWYYEGMRVVDFSKCQVGKGFESCTKQMKEVAHFVDDGTGPNSLNDHSNFWGVYLHDHPDGNTYILGSDRDSGLWIFALPQK